MKEYLKRQLLLTERFNEVYMVGGEINSTYNVCVLFECLLCTRHQGKGKPKMNEKELLPRQKFIIS